jgi:hypothetical protein
MQIRANTDNGRLSSGWLRVCGPPARSACCGLTGVERPCFDLSVSGALDNRPPFESGREIKDQKDEL